DIGTRDILAHVLDRDIGELAAVCVDNAGDQYGADECLPAASLRRDAGGATGAVDRSDGPAAHQRVTSMVSSSAEQQAGTARSRHLAMIIQSLLDTDLYKFTMMQVVLHHFPGAEVEYRFKCRNADVPLAPYIGEIQ